jgi:hypothetical protein
MPGAGIHSLLAAMHLWHWALLQFQQQTDARGARLLCDARQGVTFPMADALCWLLAARSLTLDALDLQKGGHRQVQHASVLRVFSDLCTIASVCAAGAVKQTCTALLLGYDPQFPVSAATRQEFDNLRATIDRNLRGAGAARDSVARFLHAQQER